MWWRKKVKPQHGWKNGSRKCDQLATYGTQYELQAVFKTVALQQMLIGETRRAFDVWKMDGLPYEILLVKLKEYARSQGLDGEAARGKQAVDLSKTTSWAETTEEAQEAGEPVHTEEELNAFANVKCFTAIRRGTALQSVPLRKPTKAMAKARVRGKEKEKEQTKAKARAR